MSVTSAQGFLAAGITAGLKISGNPDLALVVNQGPDHNAAAVFTSNRVAAAPVHWSRQVLGDGKVAAVVLNSGGANACTGPEGYQNTLATAEKAAVTLGISSGDVVVCSTGLIGEQLPMEKILPGIEAAAAALTNDGGVAAAVAIMTTDTVPKEVSWTSAPNQDGLTYTIGGMAKGAGMLAPGLATMLVVITTDAVVESDGLDASLRDAVRISFDRADSDGCMSTNDTVVLLSSGASAVFPVMEEFTAGLSYVCATLARALIADAEGAHHDISISTINADSERDAEIVSRSVARSNLFKCAIFGNDPNWGRVLAAVGTTDAAFDPNEIDVSINGVQICRRGGIGDSRDLVDLRNREVLVEINLHAGDSAATIWTNDLTHDYVEENSAYSS